MAVDLNNPVYAALLSQVLQPSATTMLDAYGSGTDITIPSKSAAETGFFTDPVAAQAIIDSPGTLEEKYAKLGPLIDQTAFYNYTNKIMGLKESDHAAHEYDPYGGFATALAGTGLIAGAGALGGAFSGVGAAGGVASAVDPSSAMAALDSSVPGMWGGVGAGTTAGAAGTGMDTILGGAENFGTLPGAGTLPTGVTSAAGTVASTAASGADLASTISKIMDGSATAADYLKLLGPAMSIGSGVYGLSQSANLSKDLNTDVNAAMTGTSGIAEKAAKAADPWGTSGGRALADTQLQALMKDPSQVAATDPAYKLRIQAAQRAMGSYGQGSGGMAVAGADASTSWLDNRLASLAGLENMGNPVAAQQVGIAQTQQELDAARLKYAGASGANTLAGQSMASMAFGATQATGGNTSSQVASLTSPAVQDWLRSMGVRI